MHLSLRAGGIALALFASLALVGQDRGSEPAAEDRVDEVFARWDTTNGPGCAVSVVENGEVVFMRGYGMANLDHDVPNRTDTIFHVASVSKEFTAATIALLALDGKLSLDDTIQQHLPWVPEFEHPITIRNLIHHNSGIRDQWSLLGMSGWRYSRDLITDNDVIYLIKRQRDLNFRPGDRYTYSNTGYTLLALIVKAVSGQSLRGFTTSRIFEPLGMSRTHFRDDFSEIVKDQAYGYRWDEGDSVFRLSVTNFDTVGATSLLTTVEDMARWDRNFIDPAVGGPDFLDLMHRPGTLNDGEEQDYAFGLTHGSYRGVRTVGHGGADAGYRSNFLRFPDHRYSFVVLCNLAQTNPGRLAQAVADIYLEEQLEPIVGETGAPDDASAAAPPVPIDEGALSRVEGVYWWEERGIPLRIGSPEGTLELSVGETDFEIVHTGDGRFLIPRLDRVARFTPTTGEATAMALWPPGDESSIDMAAKIVPSDDTSNLLDYIGAYQSPELPVVYYIDMSEETLVLHWLKRDSVELTEVAHDVLMGSAGSLRFQRGSDGQISGFVLDSGRVRNFRFERVR